MRRTLLIGLHGVVAFSTAACFSTVALCETARVDEALRATKLQLRRDAERPYLPWAEFKAIQMERLALEPGSSLILRELADRSWGKARLEEVVAYYRESIEAERAITKQLAESGDVGVRRYYEVERWRYELNERVVSAIIELLPNFYAGQGKVSIGVNFLDQTVDLIEWPSKRILCSIDVRATTNSQNGQSDLEAGRQEP